LKIRNWCRYKPRERRLIEEVTRPILETQKVPLLDTKCWRDRVGIDVEQKPINMYEEWMKRNINRNLNEYNFTALFTLNYAEQGTETEIFKKFYKHSIKMKSFSNKLFRTAIENNQNKILLPYIYGKNYYAHCNFENILDFLKLIFDDENILILCMYHRNEILNTSLLQKIYKLENVENAAIEIIRMLNYTINNIPKQLQANSLQILKILKQLSVRHDPS